MEERIVLRRGEGKLLSVDPETHQAIKAWANMEGTTYKEDGKNPEAILDDLIRELRQSV